MTYFVLEWDVKPQLNQSLSQHDAALVCTVDSDSSPLHVVPRWSSSGHQPPHLGGYQRRFSVDLCPAPAAVQLPDVLPTWPAAHMAAKDALMLSVDRTSLIPAAAAAAAAAGDGDDGGGGGGVMKEEVGTQTTLKRPTTHDSKSALRLTCASTARVINDNGRCDK